MGYVVYQDKKRKETGKENIWQCRPFIFTSQYSLALTKGQSCYLSSFTYF